MKILDYCRCWSAAAHKSGGCPPVIHIGTIQIFHCNSKNFFLLVNNFIPNIRCRSPSSCVPAAPSPWPIRGASSATTPWCPFPQPSDQGRCPRADPSTPTHPRSRSNAIPSKPHTANSTCPYPYLMSAGKKIHENKFREHKFREIIFLIFVNYYYTKTITIVFISEITRKLLIVFKLNCPWLNFKLTANLAISE